MSCPPIPFTAAEVQRERLLWRLAGAFQAQMDETQNPCALKGGTALRFQAGLSRPSTDLDFEGDKGISLRKTLMKAMAEAAPERPYRIGHNFLWRGTVTITVDDGQAGHARSAVDYRKTGSRPGMPNQVPLERCERVRGINIYTPRELVNRKLQTIVGTQPRQLARDIYDAAWIVSARADLLQQTDAAKLRAWIENVTPRRREQLKNRLQEEELTARVNANDIWEALETGIRRLKQGLDDPGGRSGGKAATEGEEKERRDSPATAKLRLGGNPDIQPPKARPGVISRAERWQGGPDRSGR